MLNRIIGLAAAAAFATIAGFAQAAPQCPREPPIRHSTIPVNSFADSMPSRAVSPAVGQCAWGVGLAILPHGTGTAFLVGNRREIITNLHVVDRNCSGNSRLEFSHGFDRGHSLSTIGATVVAHGSYCSGRKRGRHDYGGDWAIAVLDQDPEAVEDHPARRDAGPLNLRGGDLASLRRDNGRYFLVGYGMQFENGVTPYLSAGCVLDRMFSADVVEHSCNAGHRTSGAPILYAEEGGGCDMVALHVGEIAVFPGRPAYRGDRNANVAVLAARFQAAARAVARELGEGWSAEEIAADMAAHPRSR